MHLKCLCIDCRCLHIFSLFCTFLTHFLTLVKYCSSLPPAKNKNNKKHIRTQHQTQTNKKQAKNKNTSKRQKHDKNNKTNKTQKHKQNTKQTTKTHTQAKIKTIQPKTIKQTPTTQTQSEKHE